MSTDMPVSNVPSVVQLPLTRGFVALIDTQDAVRVLRWRWHAAKRRNNFYAAAWITDDTGRRRKEYLHRYILNVPAGICVDHQNLNGLDCRRSNLRICNNSNNMMNRGRYANNKTGYKGVWLDKRYGSYTAQIGINGKTIHLGSFKSPEDAAAAYCAAAQQHHGDFARIE